jgi:hypothetical protein
MDDTVVAARPPPGDALRKYRPTSIEAVAEMVLQHFDLATIERLELQQLIDVSEPEGELPVPERRDLVGDVRLEDPPALFGPLE